MARISGPHANRVPLSLTLAVGVVATRAERSTRATLVACPWAGNDTEPHWPYRQRSITIRGQTMSDKEIAAAILAAAVFAKRGETSTDDLWKRYQRFLSRLQQESPEVS